MNTNEVRVFQCDHIGATFDGTTVTEHTNWFGQHWWKAVAPIGSLFGSEVHGKIEAIGRTRDEALQRLEGEKRKLADSLWEE